jgi:two-component system, OmpR family, phosphate regulon response regulator PhoB
MALVYRLSAKGKAVLSDAGGTAELPLEYRRLLALLQVDGHIDVIRGRLRRFPDRLIDEWLKELVDLKMIEPARTTAKAPADITFSGNEPPHPFLADEDKKRLARTTVIAGATLLRQGSFLAVDRIANLPRIAKKPAETIVLLVEDDPDQAALAELRLTMAGYQVRTVDGAKALSRFLREEPRPDLLLLDVLLPDGNGFDILGKLRARPEFAMLPIVLLTVQAQLAHIRKGLALGADGYITKPYSKNQLAEVIGRVLKQS